VRYLAQRSAQAAKEIKKLIQTSVEKIGEGTLLVNQSGHGLQDIVAAVTKVSDLISEIAAAGREQTAGIHQVNKAITQMDEMIQQNTELVEAVVNSSTVMKEHAQNLKGYVAFFKTRDTSQMQVTMASSAKIIQKNR
jgi:methyl-accepting chemotaxis protein